MKRLRELEEKVATASQAYETAQQAVQQASREVQWAVNQEYEIAQAEEEEYSSGGAGLLGNMLMNSMMGAAMGGGSRSVRSRSANIPLPPASAPVNSKQTYVPSARSDCAKHAQGCQ